MMSGGLNWNSGNIDGKGIFGHSWTSTTHAYASSLHLYFTSTNVTFKHGSAKSYGFMLHCVASFSSRALRSLPLSVMMSGILYWSSGNLNNRGTDGYFWSSTPYSYTNSRGLGFGSANVNPKNGSSKPFGSALRCVARFTCVFLPELSAAFLFRL